MVWISMLALAFDRENALVSGSHTAWRGGNNDFAALGYIPGKCNTVVLTKRERNYQDYKLRRSNRAEERACEIG